MLTCTEFSKNEKYFFVPLSKNNLTDKVRPNLSEEDFESQNLILSQSPAFLEQVGKEIKLNSSFL